MADFSKIRNFKPQEFDSPDLPGSGRSVDQELVDKLQAMRDHLGYPIKINSAVRSAAHNHDVGGVNDSYHMKGQAVDVAAPLSKIYDMLAAAINVGFSGIGIKRHSGQAVGMLHLDVRQGPRVVWTYP